MTIAVHGPEALLQILDRVGEADGACIAIAMLDERIHLRHIVNIDTGIDWLRQGGRIAAQAAADLGGPPAAIALVGYGEPGAMALAAAHDLSRAWPAAQLLDVLQVADDGRYRSLLCKDRVCCPPEGRHPLRDPWLADELDAAAPAAPEPGGPSR